MVIEWGARIYDTSGSLGKQKKKKMYNVANEIIGSQREGGDG